MTDKKVVVLGAQVPFIHGGAERLNNALVSAINKHLPGVQAELVQLPFKWYPETQLIKDMAAWRLIDLSESNGNIIDLCIATKYPTYLAQHPNKVTWLVHQHRVFYDLEDSEFDVPHHSKIDTIVRKKVRSSDVRFLSESKTIYTISNTVSDRLKNYNGLSSIPIYPPPELADKIYPGPYGDYVLYIGRVERIKRIEPIIDALVEIKSLKVLIVGTGEHLPALKNYASALGVADRCCFKGYVNDDDYLEMLSRARGVYYSPIDEDYGFATIEALLAKKPVLTLADSGEVARIVKKTGGGFVCDPESGELTESIVKLMDMTAAEIENLVEDANRFAKEITWANVFDSLVLPHL